MKTTLKLYNKSNPSSSEKRPEKSYSLQNSWLVTSREITACLYKRVSTDPNEKRVVKTVPRREGCYCTVRSSLVFVENMPEVAQTKQGDIQGKFSVKHTSSRKMHTGILRHIGLHPRLLLP